MKIIRSLRIEHHKIHLYCIFILLLIYVAILIIYNMRSLFIYCLLKDSTLFILLFQKLIQKTIKNYKLIDKLYNFFIYIDIFLIIFNKKSISCI